MSAELERALLAGDLEATVRWIVAATPAQRKAARELVLGLFQAPARGGARAQTWAAVGLARLAVGKWGDVRQMGLPPGLPTGLVLEVLRAVRPDWLSKWVATHLDDRSPLAWPIARALVREGLAELPADRAGYVRSLYSWLAWDGRATEVLLADPDALGHLWWLFEVDAGVFRELYSDDHPFLRRLRELVDGGHLSRERALAESVRALTAGLDRRDLAGVTRVHESLAPTPAERTALQAAYRDLLRHPEAPVVGFALAALTEIERAGALDDVAFGAEVGPVFSLRPMNHPKAALAVLERIGARAPLLALDGVLHALQHPAPQVQERALDWLERRAGDAPIRAALRDRIGFVVDSQRPRVLALLGEAADVAPDPTDAAPDLPPGVPEALLRATRWEEVCAGSLAAVRYGPLEVPRVDRDDPVAPIDDLDALCDELSLGLSAPDPIRFERVLDAMGRLGSRIDPARLRPLAQRAEAPTGSHLAIEVGHLLAAALGLPSPRGFAWLGRGRTEEVSRRIRERRPAGRIALPSDGRGFLHPEDWARRLAHPDRDPHDRIAAMGRLAPEGRADVLPALQDAALAPERYAAGGPRPASLPDDDLWFAAARARDPIGDLTADFPQRRRARPPRYSLVLGPLYRGLPETVLRVAQHAGDAPGPLVNLLDAGFADAQDMAFAFACAPVWPHGEWAVGYARMDLRRNTAANTMEPIWPNALPLADPGIAWVSAEGEDWSMAALVAATGLVSQDPDLRGRTVDAVIAAIRDGRCDGPVLAAPLAALAAHERVKLNRLGATLVEIGRAGALPRWVAADVAMGLIARYGAPPADLHHLLEALRELLAGAERGLDPRCAPVLAPLAGKTKTGKLAKELLARTEETPAPPSVRAEAVAGRRERLLAWSSARG